MRTIRACNNEACKLHNIYVYQGVGYCNYIAPMPTASCNHLSSETEIITSPIVQIKLIRHAHYINKHVINNYYMCENCSCDSAN